MTLYIPLGDLGPPLELPEAWTTWGLEKPLGKPLEEIENPEEYGMDNGMKITGEDKQRALEKATGGPEAIEKLLKSMKKSPNVRDLGGHMLNTRYTPGKVYMGRDKTRPYGCASDGALLRLDKFTCAACGKKRKGIMPLRTEAGFVCPEHVQEQTTEVK